MYSILIPRKGINYDAFPNILNSEYKLYSTLKGVAFLRYFLFSISLAFLINFISHNSIKIYTKFLISLILFLILDSYIQFFFGKDISYNDEKNVACILGRFHGVFETFSQNGSKVVCRPARFLCQK